MWLSIHTKGWKGKEVKLAPVSPTLTRKKGNSLIKTNKIEPESLNERSDDEKRTTTVHFATSELGQITEEKETTGKIDLENPVSEKVESVPVEKIESEENLKEIVENILVEKIELPRAKSPHESVVSPTVSQIPSSEVENEDIENQDLSHERKMTQEERNLLQNYVERHNLFFLRGSPHFKSQPLVNLACQF